MRVNYLFHKDYYSRRTEYVIRTIAGRLGYPYKIIKEAKSIRKQDLTITYVADGDLDQLPQHTGLSIYNSRQIDHLEQVEQSINLFEQKNITVPIVGKRLVSDDLPDWKMGKNGIYYKKNRSNPWLISIDIFLNVFFHFSRFEEKWRHFTEETSTDHSSSILSRYQNLRVPAVDVLINYLDVIIRDRIRQDRKIAVRVLPWPGGEDMGVAFTHDIDITRGVKFKTRLVKRGEGYLYKLLGKPQPLENAKKEIKEKDAQSWNLPELITHYKERNWTATFFFIAKILEGTHLRYNIFSGKFKRLFKQLTDNKHEIALHPSKFAFDRPRYYREEKRKLENASGVEVKGMRQHYLRAKFPRLWVLAERAALKYDSSLGYNFQAGFRAGTTHPFKTFDVIGNKPLSLTEFSLHLFEYNLPDSGENIEGSKKTISELTDEVTKYNGLLVSLLHPSNFVHNPYKELWLYFEKILLHKNIFVATLSEHLEWLRIRERINVSMIYSRKSLPEIQITFPDDQQKVSIELIGDVKPLPNEKIELKKLGKGSFCLIATEPRCEISLVKMIRS
jgi:peptidoglycan/xylan/chitin deacetylase (PgdA/CDA1 family)